MVSPFNYGGQVRDDDDWSFWWHVAGFAIILVSVAISIWVLRNMAEGVRAFFGW